MRIVKSVALHVFHLFHLGRREIWALIVLQGNLVHFLGIKSQPEEAAVGLFGLPQEGQTRSVCISVPYALQLQLHFCSRLIQVEDFFLDPHGGAI